MKRLATLFLLVASLTYVGCGSSGPAPVEKLPGRWYGRMVVDTEAVAGKLKPDQITQLESMEMGFEFSADGAMVLTAFQGDQPQDSLGTWEVVSQDANLLKIRSHEKGGEPKDINIEFDGDDTFYMPLKTEVADIGAMRFERVR